MFPGGIGLLVSVLALGLFGANAGSAKPKPSPELLKAKPMMLVGPLYPLTVRGVRFKPWERVTVTLDGGKRGTVRTVANRSGAFRAEFRVRVQACRTVTIRAVGAQGSKVVRQLPRPHCREP